jgi:hypothetical protein
LMNEENGGVIHTDKRRPVLLFSIGFIRFHNWMIFLDDKSRASSMMMSKANDCKPHSWIVQGQRTRSNIGYVDNMLGQHQYSRVFSRVY